MPFTKHLVSVIKLSVAATARCAFALRHRDLSLCHMTNKLSKGLHAGCWPEQHPNFARISLARDEQMTTKLTVGSLLG